VQVFQQISTAPAHPFYTSSHPPYTGTCSLLKADKGEAQQRKVIGTVIERGHEIKSVADGQIQHCRNILAQIVAT